VPAEDVASLDVFLNPEYAQRMTLPDNVDDAYSLAYLATGVTDWTNATEEQFQAASDWLRQVHPNLRTYWTDPAELAALHATGEILVSWAWNESLPTLVPTKACPSPSSARPPKARRSGSAGSSR
jgi:spermidine/putrescine transport system substrate-binding protein